jgi:hypothetical protein
MQTPGTIKVDPGSPLAIRLRTASSFIDEQLALQPMTHRELRDRARQARVNRTTLSVLVHARLAEGKLTRDACGKLSIA